LLLPSSSVVIAAVVASGVVSTVTDIRTRRVPNWLTLGISTLGISLAALHATPLSVAGAIGGCAVGLLLMMPGHVVGATGAGDVKLFGAIGTLLGPTLIGTAFLYTAVVAGALAVVVAAHRGRLRKTFEGTAMLVRTGGSNVAEIESPSADNRFAYAPAIAIGVVAAAMGF
jgi:prepilin peptidase CpaA